MAKIGFSQERLKKMHDILAEHVANGATPGLATRVSRRGETHFDAIGNIDFEGSQPIQRDNIFRISSLTKPVTAAATLILVEEGKIRLHEPVDRLLPELADRKVLKRLDGPLDDTVPASRPITVYDLLTFTFGFGLVFASPETHPILAALVDLNIGLGMPSPAMHPGPDEWIKRFGSLPLLYQPGERWLYNTGSDVLGVLIARASSTDFESFLQERIFDPLGMKDTSFSVPPEKVDRFTPQYVINHESGKPEVYDPREGGQWNTPPAFPTGGAGLVSTIDDYHAFGQMMLNYGKLDDTRILSRPSVELMTTDQLTPAQKAISGMEPGAFENHGWGFGVGIDTRRNDLFSVGRFGWDGGLGSTWYADPREDLIGIMMTPHAWLSPVPPDHFVDFWTMTYAAIED